MPRDQLRRGKTKQCNDCRIKNKFIDLKGQKFGEYTVLRHSPQVGDVSTFWDCQCSCGTIKRVHGQPLRQGRSKRCIDCAIKLNTIVDRKCKWCGIKLSKESPIATQCVKHARILHRNGLCPCGKFPKYKFKACPKCEK